MTDFIPGDKIVGGYTLTLAPQFHKMLKTEHHQKHLKCDTKTSVFHELIKNFNHWISLKYTDLLF